MEIGGKSFHQRNDSVNPQQRNDSVNPPQQWNNSVNFDY